jgi:hypothetical protein
MYYSGWQFIKISIYKTMNKQTLAEVVQEITGGTKIQSEQII